MRKPAPSDRGVTLVELMVVLAIVGVLTAVAGVAMKKSSYGRGAYGMAHQFAARIADARMRAVAMRRWQCVRIGTDIVHIEAQVVGLAAPAPAAAPPIPPNWQEVTTLPLMDGVTIPATDQNVDHGPAGVTVGGTPAPTEGICFSPDGSHRAPGADPVRVTVFFRDEQQRLARVFIYGVTGNEYVLEGW